MRLKLEKLQEDFETYALLTIGVPMAGGVTFAVNPAPKGSIAGVIIFVLTAGFVALRARKLMRQARALWDHRLGFEGERVVGEELNQLMPGGHWVFHDVVFEDFNVDHVVVGPAGLYAIETKTKRKPKSPEAGKKYKVTFDGKSLHWPWGKETKDLEQAERGAAAIAKWLSSATGERVLAKPVLLIPGWWVELTAVGAVAVLNPKQVHAALPLPGAVPLSQAQITRIAHQLRERCRMDSN